MNFGIGRIFIAMTACACSFAALRSFGSAGVLVASWIGLSAGLICLIVKRNQIWPMFRTGVCTVLGGAAGCVLAGALNPVSAPGSGLVMGSIGGIIGFMIGVELTASQNRLEKSGLTSGPNDERMDRG